MGARGACVPVIAGAAALLALAAVADPHAPWIQARADAAVARAAEKKDYARVMIERGLVSLRWVSGINGCVLLLAAGAIARHSRRRADMVSPPPAGADAPTPTRFWRDAPVVLPLMALAAGLRSAGLQAGLWYDEIFTYQRFIVLPLPEIPCTYFVPNNHIAFTLASRAVLSLANWPTQPDNIAACLRIVPALSGVALVAAVYLLARGFTTHRGAWLAGLIAALSPILVEYSQQARGHIMAAALAAWATVLLITATRRTGTARWVSYALCTALMIYTVPAAAFVPLAHGLALGAVALRPGESVMRPGTLRRWAVAALGAGMAAAQLYAFVLPQAWAFFRDSQAAAQDATFQWSILSRLCDQLTFSVGLGAPAVAGGIVVLVAAIRQCAYPDRRVPVAVCLAVAIVPFVVRPVWSGGAPRFFLFAAGHAACLVALTGGGAMERFSRRPRRALAATAILSLLVLALCVPGLRRQWRTPPQPIREAVLAAFDNADPGDRIIAAGMAARECAFYKPPERKLLHAPTPERLVRLIDRARRDNVRRLWIILTYPQRWQRRAELQPAPAVILPGRIPDGDVHLYTLDPNTPPVPVR